MIRIRTRAAAAVGVAATAAMAAVALGASPAHAESTVLGADSDNAVRGSFIVKLTDDQIATKADNSIVDEYGAKLVSELGAMNAFTVKMSSAEAREMAADPAVEYVQQSQRYTTQATQDNPPSWGLDRLDQDATEGDNAYNYPDSAGEGVTAYVIDTGVDYENADFDGRASSGIDAVDGDDDAMDEHGHGTHVAGTIAGTEYGIAKNANIVAVRVLDANGSGTTEGVVEGINWVAENAAENSVANMSLGGGKDQALDDAVSAAIEAGVTFGVAAGNETADACQGSPSGTPDAITVAASDNADAFASFSNFGSCVDITAPGVDIVSDAPGGGSATMSGTSMATPHVVGAAALYLGENPGAAPADVASALVDNSIADAVSGTPADTANQLLNTGFLLGDTDPGDPGDPGDPADCTATADAAVEIPDNDSVESVLSLTCDRDAGAADATVSVDITHSWAGDLAISLVSPSGTTYELKEADLYDSNEFEPTTYTVDLSNEAASGDWTLVVSDEFYAFTGTLNSWDLTV